MKIKAALLICALLGVIFSLAGCVDKNKDAGQSGTTTTTTIGGSSAPTTSATTTTTTMGTMDDGEYEAGRDGIVSEGTNSGGDAETPSDIANDRLVPEENDRPIASDDAAFAPSYIGRTALKNEKIGWGLGKERDDKNRPVDAVRAEEKYKAYDAHFLTSDGKICLTFDEGYENGYTAAILDTLKEKGVKAVFFVTYDYCRTAPELVKRIIDEGHTVGNHSWAHPSMPDLTQKEVWADVTKLHQYVLDEFGYEMKLFRFPKGEFSERTLDDIRNLGYTTLFWSFAYADWDTNAKTDPAEALAKIKDSTHSGIYLLHAVSETNAQILAPLIDYWREQGYEVGSEL